MPRSSPSRRRIRLWLGRGLLVLGSVLLCAVVLEIYLRLTLEFKPNLSIYLEDFEIGKRLEPGFQGEHYGVAVSINSQGMRDREFSFEKPPGTFRILALGDSWTFGAGVEQDRTWPKQLEEMLTDPGRPVEVLNTGVSGYETYHESVVYASRVRDFEHDLVLVGLYPVNDAHDKKRKYDRKKWLYDLHPWLYRAYTFPKTGLYISQVYRNWRKARKQARRNEYYAAAATDTGSGEAGFARGEADWTGDYTDDRSGWLLMKESLLSIGATARERGVPGVVVLFPDLSDLARYERYCHPKVAPLIEAAVRDAGLEWIDLCDAFHPYVGREVEINNTGDVGATHPGPEGCAVIARAIADGLRAQGLR